MDYSKPDQYVGPAIKAKYFLPWHDLKAAYPKRYAKGPLVTDKDKAIVNNWLEIMKFQGHDGSSYNGLTWKVLHGMYEYSLNMTLTIVMAFYFIEFPAMGIEYDLETIQTFMIPFLIFDHALPATLMLVECWHNSIEIEWRRFPLYFGINLTYVLYISIYNESLTTKTYSFMNWNQSPFGAATGFIVIACYQFLTYYCMVLFSRRKLRYAQLAEYFEVPEVPEKPKDVCDKNSDDSDYDREFCVVQGGKREEGYVTKDVPHDIVNPLEHKTNHKLKSARRQEDGLKIKKVDDVVLIVLE